MEAHDNFNLHDLLAELHPDDDILTRTKRIELATAMNLLMGYGFHGGWTGIFSYQARSYGEDDQVLHSDRERAMNSYNAPDAVNQVNWDILQHHQESIDLSRTLFVSRQAAKPFLSTYEDIYKHVFVQSAEQGSG